MTWEVRPRSDDPGEAAQDRPLDADSPAEPGQHVDRCAVRWLTPTPHGAALSDPTPDRPGYG
ncbi:hypothetical protein ACTD5D_00475 [Nocardia takedensis]|uniref:hypothetical protein n=1 Tax=Nocardia takedensis TaxID=259390 RepID=UPI0002E5C5D6